MLKYDDKIILSSIDNLFSSTIFEKILKKSSLFIETFRLLRIKHEHDKLLPEYNSRKPIY